MGTTTKAESGWRYVLVGILLFILLGMDYLSILVGKLLDGRPLSDPELWSVHWYATVGTFLCSVILWAVSVALIVVWARRRGALGSLFSFHRNRWVVLVLCLGVVVLAIISWLESSNAGEVFPSLVKEYRGFEQRYPEYSATVTAAPLCCRKIVLDNNYSINII